ncbi:MAG TPA: phosphotransferase family protein [Marmoricola sp.]|nr:phosphotransferase family protein [Marmoricola sp.]
MPDSGPARDEDVLQAVRAAAPEAASGLVRAVRLPGGASRETWLLHREDAEPLVLRLNTPGSLDPQALLREGALIRTARAGGVPSPEVHAQGRGPGPLSDGFVLMEHLPGEAVPQRILRDPALADVRRRLPADCGRILARIHDLDVAALEAETDLSAVDQLDEWSGLLRADPEPHPILEHVSAWLRRHRPELVPPRLVHGDFRLGNLLVDPGGIRGVLDWELAHLGDPAEDLAWLTIRAWRFGRPEEVAGCGAVDDLVQAYTSAGGSPVEPDRLRWWQVMGCFRWGVICLHQGGRHLSGAERSVELAAVGRRVAEAEYDAMLLLT